MYLRAFVGIIIVYIRVIHGSWIIQFSNYFRNEGKESEYCYAVSRAYVNEGELGFD